jgi:DNA-binding MarR family transcriptional regulator
MEIPSVIYVYNAPMKPDMRELHDVMLDFSSMMNRPTRDGALLEAAHVAIDRALFPLLVYIERKGPIGVGDLADVVGRDYTTVSRQAAKLDSLGYIQRRASQADSRINEAIITARGKSVTDSLDRTRQQLAERLLKDWSNKDLKELTRLMRRFVDDLVVWRGGE